MQRLSRNTRASATTIRENEKTPHPIQTEKCKHLPKRLTEACFVQAVIRISDLITKQMGLDPRQWYVPYSNYR